MKKINFEDGTKVSNAKVTIDGVDYPVTPARYTGATPLSAYVMKKLQDNIETGINEEQSKINKSTDEYSSTSTYSTGDLVIYNNKLYKASQDITTAEEFNSEHWTETSITAELGTRLEFEEIEV